MIRFPLIALFLFIGISTAYTQNKEKIKGDRNVTIAETPINSFNRIVIGENFKISLIEGENAQVYIETDENLQDVIQFNVADSTLYFNTSKRITSFKKMDIKVTYTRALKQIETNDKGEVSSLTSIDLDEITLMHSGNSRAYLNLKSPKFKLINSDKAKVKLNVKSELATIELNDNSKMEALIEADSLQVDLYMRSEGKIEGTLQRLDVRADNSSIFQGKNLTASRANLECDLNSDVYVQVLEELNISALGNSEVYVYENPKINLIEFTGTAKLHKKEMKKK